MNAAFHELVVFASQDLVLARYLHDKWPLLSLAVGLMVVVLWAVAIWKRRQQTGRRASRRLLKELCTAHRLRHYERRLVYRVAVLHRLEQPALVFLDPHLWDAAGLGAFGERYAAEIAILRRRLFGSPATNG